MANEIKLTPAQRGRMYGLIKRLESGKYTQTKGMLRSCILDKDDKVVESYNCCLGVAGEMLVEKKITSWILVDKKITDNEHEENNGRAKFGIEHRYSTGMLPNHLASLFGFDSLDDNGLTGQEYYWVMNDRGKSFIEIATELRKNFGFKTKEQDDAMRLLRNAK